MAYKNLNFVQNYIADLCASNAKLSTLFVELEKALTEKIDLQESRNRLQANMQNLRVDLMLVRQAANIMCEERKNTDDCAQVLESSYHHLLEMISLLADDKVKNISCFAVLCKQNEVQDKLTRMETLQQYSMELNAVMERRTIVKEFRKCQQLLKDAEEKTAIAKIDSEQLKQQCRVKINRATQQRNNKIVALVKLRQQIAEAQKEVNMSDHETAIKVRDLSKKTLRPRCKPTKLPLKSALDFISHIFEGSNEEAKIKFPEPRASNLRSILAVNRAYDSFNETVQIPILTKQVHFAPTPSPVQEDAPAMSSIRESDENTIDMELFSEPVTEERDNKPNDNGKRANILSVEVLPTFKFPTIARKGDALNFNKLFSGNESSSENSTEGSKEFEEQSSIKKLTNTFQSSPEQSKDLFETNINNNLNTLNFSSPNCPSNDDFFLNFDDVSSTEVQNNNNSYEL